MNNSQKNQRHSKHLSPKNNRNKKGKTIYKTRDTPKFRSGAKPNNRTRDSGVNRVRRRTPRKKDLAKDADGQPFQLHKVVCDACKKDTEVPFLPTGTKPVYCRKCYNIQNNKKDSSTSYRKNFSKR